MSVINYQRWAPPRFFYSHATKDFDLTQVIHDCLRSKVYDVYISERNLVGKPLIEKLRDEMLCCNALLVGWTEDMSERHIISFEIGMAYSLGLPIFLFLFDDNKSNMPWFFDKITDYQKIKSKDHKDIMSSINSMEPFSFINPIDIIIPKNPEGSPLPSSNKNQQVVNDDGSLNLWDGFNYTLRLYLKNTIDRPIKDLRYRFLSSNNLTMEVTPGELDGSSRTQRNEFYEMWPPSKPTNVLNWYWHSFPVMTMIFDIRLSVIRPIGKEEALLIQYTSENTIKWKSKAIPIKWIVMH